MPRKRRVDKRRSALSENEINWLEGRPSGFVKFMDNDHLRALWDRYGDPTVVTWDGGDAPPRAIRRPL